MYKQHHQLGWVG